MKYTCINIFMSHFIMLSRSDLQYSADAGNVSLLLKAPLYFDLEMYTSTRQLEKVKV